MDPAPLVEELSTHEPLDPDGVLVPNSVLRGSRSNASLHSFYSKDGTKLHHSKSNASLHYDGDTSVLSAPKIYEIETGDSGFVTVEDLQKALTQADQALLLPREVITHLARANALQVVSALMKYTQPRLTTMIQGRKTAFALSVFNLMNGT